MIGSSLFIFSVGFLINSVSPVYSINTDKTNNSLKVLPNNQKVIQVPVNEDGSVNVKLSEEQMKELKSKPSGWSYNDLIGCGSGIYQVRKGRYTGGSGDGFEVEYIKVGP